MELFAAVGIAEIRIASTSVTASQILNEEDVTDVVFSGVDVFNDKTTMNFSFNELPLANPSFKYDGTKKTQGRNLQNLIQRLPALVSPTIQGPTSTVISGRSKSNRDRTDIEY